MALLAVGDREKLIAAIDTWDEPTLRIYFFDPKTPAQVKATLKALLRHHRGREIAERDCRLVIQS